MKLFTSLVSLAIAIAPAFAEYQIENGVLVLTTENFEEAVNEFDYLLAEFYAPWCGHCKTLAPEYEKAAGALKDHANIRLAKIDATVENKLAEKYEVKGFPTMKFFKKDAENAIDYGGGRQEPAISEWILKKTGPPAVDLFDKESALEFKNKFGVAVVGFYPPGSDSEPFMAAADSFDDVPFGFIADAVVAEALNVQQGTFMLKNEDDEILKVEGDIKEFVQKNQLNYVNEFNQANAPKIFGGEVKKQILLFTKSDSEDHAEKYAQFKASAKKNVGKYIFVHLDCNNEQNGQVMEFFGVSDCPEVKIVHMDAGMAKFKPESSDITEESVDAFLAGVEDGSIAKWLKTEDIPENNDLPVTVLVGKNFKEIAFNKDKTVFVEFYAPWCGHCKALAPHWEKLGEHFKDNDEVVIAKMDATLNEVDSVEIQGFPTLKMFKKGDNEIVDYPGARELDDMVKFVESGGVMPEEPEEAEQDYEDDEEEIIEEEEEAEAEQKDEL